MRKIEVEPATPEKLEALDISAWSPWSCEPSRFDWEYSADERAYVQAGHVRIHTAAGAVEIKAGDLVLFPKGLQCSWEVIEPIRKVYRFE